jgi:hypothetical protein
MKTTPLERYRVTQSLNALGIDYESAQSLRRIAMTLRNWFELECGTDRGCIERDEDGDGKPYFRYAAFNHPIHQYPIADREAGARKRLAAIMSRYPDLIHYIQGDPRVYPPQVRREWLRHWQRVQSRNRSLLKGPTPMNKPRITTQKQLRREFWETFPNLPKHKIKNYSGNGTMHRTDTRCAWCDWLDMLSKDGSISQALAQRATL